MSLRHYLIDRLGGVPKAKFDAADAKVDQLEHDLKAATRKAEAAEEKLLGETCRHDATSKEYRDYQDASEKQFNDLENEFKDFVTATVKANLQHKKAKGIVLNKLTRYPEAQAEIIRKRYQRMQNLKQL